MDFKQAVQQRTDSIKSAWNIDAGEAYLFAQQVEHMRTGVFDIDYPELKAKQLIPVDNTVNPGAETVSYVQYDRSGKAMPAGQGNMSGPGPRVDVFGRKFTNPVKHFRIAYGYSTQDQRAFAMAGRNGIEDKASATRKGMEEAFDDLGASGNTALGLTGITNHASIPLVTLPNTGPWTALSPLEILDNLAYLESQVVINSLETQIPDTLVLDTISHSWIARARVGVDNGRTVLQDFLANSPYIKEVHSWHKLNTAGATTSYRRILCYRKDPSVLQLVIPLEFTQNPEVRNGLEFVTECEGRCAGVEIKRPLGMAHADIAVA